MDFLCFEHQSKATFYSTTVINLKINYNWLHYVQVHFQYTMHTFNKHNHAVYSHTMPLQDALHIHTPERCLLIWHTHCVSAWFQQVLGDQNFASAYVSAQCSTAITHIRLNRISRKDESESRCCLGTKWGESANSLQNHHDKSKIHSSQTMEKFGENLKLQSSQYGNTCSRKFCVLSTSQIKERI